MSSLALRALPYAAAVLVPSTVLGVLYAADGRSPLWGLVGGLIGLVGALTAELVRLLVARHRGEHLHRIRPADNGPVHPTDPGWLEQEPDEK